MKNIQATLTIMKKIALLILLFISYQNYGQAIANQPSDYIVCDTLNNGSENVFLNLKDLEILVNQPTNEFTVTYYLTNVDAETGTNQLIIPYLTTGLETIFARVQENADPQNFATTSFQVILNPITVPVFIPVNPICEGTSITLSNTSSNGIIGNWNTSIIYESSPGNYTLTFTPIPGQCADFTTMDVTVNPKPTVTIPSNISLADSPFDGVATFNLTQQESLIIGNQTDLSFSYYTSISDAFSGTNQISNAASFNNTSNPQLISIRVSNNITGCFSVTSFSISVINPNPLIINFTDSNFKNKLLSASPTNFVAYSAGNPVKIDINDDFEIQYTEAAIIDSLNVENNDSGIFAPYILDLNGIEGFSNIKRFRCGGNKISNFNLNTNTLLEQVYFSSNLLTTLNTNGLLNLKELYCGFNFLTNLNVNGLNNLEIINCSYNQLASLNITSLPNLRELYCSNNIISNLTISDLLNFEYLDCSINQLEQIDVSSLSNLISLHCGSNLLTNLDVTSNINLNFMICHSNLLQTLFIKNGTSFSDGLDFSNNPTLEFICCDDALVNSIQQSIIDFNYTNCTVNSYCSFTPGGIFNTITGTAIIDGNNNGCTVTDSTMPYLGLNVSLNGISTTTSVYTNGLGIYNLFTTFPGIYQLTANFENPTYFNFSSVEVDSNTIDNSTILQNICITPNGTHPDVEVVLAPINPARPGFDASYELVYKNKGNQTLSGTVTFNYNDAILDYVSATTAPTSQATGVVNWNYSNLQPFENRSIGFILNVNSPVETPAVNINDVLNFTTSISPIAGDEIPSDNTFVFNQTVVGSYDPNDITCLQGDTVSPTEIGSFLHYVINFENTGTYYAENVVVQDIIDSNKYDISSLQILNASHPMQARINGNKVEFIFQNINLDAVSGNPPVGGHGNVLFKIRSKNTLASGDYVTKNANIFFDYNAPIVTNDAETTFATLNNGVFNPDASLSVYPNPTNSILNIKSDNTIESIELYDIQGRILEKSFQSSNTVILDISNRQNGIYFLKITSDKGSKVEKIVKK